jgi:sugar/nucleoside kinase (ribokinase family)
MKGVGMIATSNDTSRGRTSARRERLLIGGVCLDEILGVEAWESPKSPVVFRRRSIGGGAANAAIAHRRLSPQTPLTLLAPLGDDEPARFLRRRLSQERIRAPLPPVAGAASCRSTVIVPRQGRSKILTEANVRERPLPRDAIAFHLGEAAACCLVAPGCNDQIGEIAAEVRKAGVPLYLGLSARQTKGIALDDLAAMLAPGAELVMCNEAESQQLTGCGRIEEALELMQRLARVAIISRGQRGLVAHDGKRLVEQPAWRDPQQAFVDDTGCGDAAFGAITDALIRGVPLETALAIGARMAFAAGTAWGATEGLIDRQAMAAFLRERPATVSVNS